MDHSKLIGGSTAARAIACPYSITAPKHPMPESEFAAEGTFLHDVMEQLLRGDIDEEFLEDVPGINEELIDNKVFPALDAFDDLADQYLPDGADWEVFLPEDSYAFDPDGPLAGCFGTTDFIGRYASTLVILDWKFGDGVAVDAVDNMQAKYYCAAARDQKPELFEGVDKLVVAIVQPVRGQDCELKLWEINGADEIHRTLDETYGALCTALDAAAKAKPNPGDHCRFCAHKPLCPGIQTIVSTALMEQPEAMTREQLGEAMNRVKLIESHCADIMKLGQAVLEEGDEIPGWKLVAKRANRSWTDEEAVEKKLRGMKIPAADMKEVKLRTPAQIERVVKKQGKDFGKLNDLIVAQSSGNTLAPESDKRPAVPVLKKQLEELGKKLGY